MGAIYWSEAKGKLAAWENTDLLAMVGLGGLTLLARLPFQATLLSNFDAINYALALDHFDMRLSQPQAPGYILYILLGRLFRGLFNDDLAALVWLSVVFSVLTTIAFYLAGRDLFNRRVGVVAALLAATSTSLWYLSEIAAPYTADVFASVIIGWLCCRLLMTPGRTWLWWSALALGLAGALRPQTLVFLLPLFLFAARRPFRMASALESREGAPVREQWAARPWRWVIAGTALAGAVFGLFFVPSVIASGGAPGFIKAMKGILPIFRDTETLVRSTQGARFVQNAFVLLRYTVQILGELVLPLFLVGVLAQPGIRRFWRSPRLVFLILWFLPAWLVFFLIWPGNLGTVAVSFPAFFLLAAAGVDALARRPGWRRVGAFALLGAALVWNVLVFAWLPSEPLGKGYRHFDNYASLQREQAIYRNKLAIIRGLPAESTLILADNFRHPQYYLDQYRTFTVPRLYKNDPSVVRGAIAILGGEMQTWRDVSAVDFFPAGVQYIVFFDRPAEIAAGSLLTAETLRAGGISVEVVPIPAGQKPIWTPSGLAVQ